MTSEKALVVRLRRTAGAFTSPRFCKLVNIPRNGADATCTRITVVNTAGAACDVNLELNGIACGLDFECIGNLHQETCRAAPVIGEPCPLEHVPLQQAVAERELT